MLDEQINKCGAESLRQEGSKMSVCQMPDTGIYYNVRCDKHAFKPYDYCEMCMIRSDLRVAIDTNRKETQSAIASASLAINVIHKMLDKLQKEINDFKKSLCKND
jgi:septal ring factor EnvC (AmiA/AmiB activator)